VIGGTAQQRSKPRRQLGHREGFDQIVIRARFQSSDAVVDLIERGQDQDRYRQAPGAHPCGYDPAVQIRQTDIEHYRIQPVCRHHSERVGAISSRRDGVALEFEPAPQRVDDDLVVINNEDARLGHATGPSSNARAAARAGRPGRSKNPLPPKMTSSSAAIPRPILNSLTVRLPLGRKLTDTNTMMSAAARERAHDKSERVDDIWPLPHGTKCSSTRQA
jgi:hypothetical protein